jgi:hypothetical protein
LADDVKFPAVGTVLKNAPMFWLRDDSRAPVVLLPAGASVDVEGREGPFLKVVYHDEQLGDQKGYLSPFDVLIDPTTAPALRTIQQRKVSQRGFVLSEGFGFPQVATNDGTRGVGDALFRDELFLKPNRWLQLAAGLDVRANSHGEVEHQWRLDFDDRSVLRPRAAVHRLSMAVATRRVTIDVGKQFIRWGRADILSPTDRFAPRDYLNVVDTEFLPVLGVRGAVNVGGETFESVWLPHMTPSRVPLLDQRWTVVPSEAAGFLLRDNGAIYPNGSEQGLRWSHTGRFEMGWSYFNGFNHLPDIDAQIVPARHQVNLTRTYSAIRTYGTELSVPTPLITIKAEAAYFTSPSSLSEEYVLYVVEAERQVGEWMLDGGYAGDAVTKSGQGATFGSERGVAQSFIGHASYTVNPRRTLAVEAAVRQNGNGLYAKGELSQAFAQHWRLTLAGVAIAGKNDDFLGQYHRNSHASIALRLSF